MSQVSILALSAYNRLAILTGKMLRPFFVDLYTPNGKANQSFGFAEVVKFHLECYELETKFVVVDKAASCERIKF